MPKHIKLNNYVSSSQYLDSLHGKAQLQRSLCTANTCYGSVMQPPSLKAEGPREKADILRHAKDFIDQYFSSHKRAGSSAHEARWKQVEDSINESGTYELTETELIYGAKLAWRNAPRCIGRIQWSKLQVFDCRSVTTSSGMFEAICNHIKYSTNKGNIRSAITIFPQRRGEGKLDFKVWNPQLIMYAGYKDADGSIIGDPLNVEFTEVCTKLGWKGKGTMFDILPLVLSANGDDPDYFVLPPDLILECPLAHPSYEWFEEMGIKWYVVPAVSSMMLDCGGLQFTACPFNGWYMSTEIACRDLCDPQRFNILEKIAQKMNLDTRTAVTLWKDKALVEINIAVLYSFQRQNITIVDHHTASESFMKHYENEQRLRNGCPGDWVWIVPPMSASITSVYHQEMANYLLYPAYLYQEPAWKVHEWKDTNDIRGKKDRKKFHFKQVARAVKFTSKLFGDALSKRIQATILYATETGKSEIYAKKLSEIFSHAFHSKVYRMDEYDISRIEHEALLLIVASTFGNGDPPENGQEFAHHLYAMKMEEHGSDEALASSASFIKANSQAETGTLERADSVRGSVTDDVFGLLSNVRFSVFGLGSSAYPNFCSFGAYVDNLLGELGGERLMKLTKGDEMCGQEQAFKKWAREVFSVACDTFCLDTDDTMGEVTQALDSEGINASNVRFVEASAEDLLTCLAKYHNKKVWKCPVMGKRNLHGKGSSRVTLQLEIGRTEDLKYLPGDHVGVIPANKAELVDGIIARLDPSQDPDKPVSLQTLHERHTPEGVQRNWVPHERLPCCSVRTMLSRFLDITTPPSTALLQFFASIATDQQDKEKLTKLATDSRAYEDWRHWKYPHLLETLEEFHSVRPIGALLVAQLTPLQPRFYSISSAPMLYPNQVHLTVAVVQYNTMDGKGPMHYGVASNYMYDLNIGEEMYMFVRSAPNFRLPEDTARPVIMVGPGTGIAPFRGFWQHRMVERSLKGQNKFGKMSLFFGCQLKAYDLYEDEKAAMVTEGVLSKVYLALSREQTIPKTYVQDLMRRDGENMYNQLVTQKGHFYVCGDCTMAEHVLQTLKEIIQDHGKMTFPEVEKYILTMRDENRYHEDIFGITLRTAEVQNKSRETAKIRLASESQP